MGLYKNFVSQTRKPEGTLGKMMVNGMNGGHAKFETIYFWPGLERCFSEVARVLKTGGSFMIVNESDGTDSASLKFEKIIDGMKCYTIDDIISALTAAGFTDIKSFHHETKPWITVIATK